MDEKLWLKIGVFLKEKFSKTVRKLPLQSAIQNEPWQTRKYIERENGNAQKPR